MSDLIERLRAATMGFDWSDLPDDALIPAVPLLREAVAALDQERDEWEQNCHKAVFALAEAKRLLNEAMEAHSGTIAKLVEAKRLGGMLANAAYNICQRGTVDAVTLRSLNEARQAWDDMPARFLSQEPNHER